MWFKQYKQYLLNTEHVTVIHVRAHYFTHKTSRAQSDLAMHIYNDLQGLPNDRTHAVD